MAEPTFVKVAQLGKAVKEVYLEANGMTPTVRDALRAAEITVPSGHAPRVSGEAATLDTALEDGDVVTLVPSVKGGN